MIIYQTGVFSYSTVTNRVADELPCLLLDAEQKKRLEECLLNPFIFLRLYRRYQTFTVCVRACVRRTFY